MNKPWLDSSQNNTLTDIFEKTIIHELRARHMGANAPGKSPGSVPRLYIFDLGGLYLAAGALRSALDKMDTDVFYRGQRCDWSLCPSLYRDLQKPMKREMLIKEDVKLNKILNEIKSKFHKSGIEPEREALAQHYGLPTRCLGVVDNIQTAAWFAYHKPGKAESDKPSSYDGVGYIELLGVPRNSDKWEAVDLRRLSSEYLRPHVQQAFSIRSKKTLSCRQFFDPLNIVTFVVPMPLLKLWSNYEVLSPEIMFPNDELDSGYAYWKECEKLLKKKGLITRKVDKKRR